MDIPTIAAVLTSIKSATDIAKLLKETDLSLEKAEVKLKLSDLYSSLADAKMQIADVQDLLREKDTKIRELEEALAFKASLEYEAPYYWRVQDGKKEGPLCQRCYDSNGKLIRLQRKGVQGGWHCSACNQDFYDSSFRSKLRGRLVGG